MDTAFTEDVLPAPAIEGPPDWYKDAVIYQLHVKAFMDSDNDGLGDFNGLMRRLDYVEELGVNAIWILPFYPSPLRDDGYDISEYTAVNPAYGRMEDVRRFIEEAHRRGIRVITELIINHTSDQHPWFQRARRAPPGSPERDYYVWSDTDEKFPETRIIFTDTEKSNWTWDAEAGAFFWHRFYSHQPDLNFDNPEVLDKVVEVMHFWLGLGVDGLRLDAIPYLIEREGTNNENLPETHEVLKTIRAALDQRWEGRMLLAEANQWPEDTRPYFGEGDECHMAFHFPLMPRMYMAVAQEDRHPVTDILRQTPAIPDPCQWAIFLRNHDELTLEMVTDRERDYLWSFYAADRKARINMGIRRRLAPLLDGDRRKVELMNGLLFSMPGTPVIYYGDEIGMGDNYYLGDRDGVRTPMQWSADRNGGFSRARPQELYLPTIQDPVYGYEAVNVEAQTASSGSLLNWMKRVIRMRARHPAMARGRLGLLYPSNRRILAYTRSHEDETVLCVFNVSRTAQAVELDLSDWRGAVPVELEGGATFPQIGELPYLLTLPPYGFFWFQLADAEELPEWRPQTDEPAPDLMTLTCASREARDLLTADSTERLGREILPAFLPRQRWFGAKGERFRGSTVALGPTLDGARLALADVETDESGAQTYFLPLKPLWGEEHGQAGSPTLSATLSRLRRTNRMGALIDAAADPGFAQAMVRAMRGGESVESGGVAFRASGEPGLAALDGAEDARPLGVEQSNVSLAFGDRGVLKIYRRLRPGAQPDIEIGRFLTQRTGFENTPAFLGEATLTRDGEQPATVAACFDFVRNQGDGWSAIVDALERVLEDEALMDGSGDAPPRVADDDDGFPFPLDLADVLGRRTGELHNALAAPTDDPAFAAEPVTRDDIAAWTGDLRAQAGEAMRRLGGSRAPEAAALRDREGEVGALLDGLEGMRPDRAKTRIHGDYHLGQILVAQADIFIIDFEGEPRRSLEERRAKSSPLRDVAGMLRSFDYAAFAALDRLTSRGIETDHARALAERWRDRSADRFLSAYAEASGADPGDPLLRLFLAQKAFYEIGYEAANRPGWLSIPVRGVLALLDGARS